MIGKVMTGSSVRTCLLYNSEGTARAARQAKQEAAASGSRYTPRGELLYFHKCDGSSISRMSKDFLSVRAMNPKLKHYVLHLSFSFHAKDKPTSELMVQVAKEAARRFGFSDNTYAVFRHRDKPHEHFHIVASRIHESGKTTVSTGQSYWKANAFCREMEQKLGLTPVASVKQEKASERLDRKAQRLDQTLSTAISGSENTTLKAKAASEALSDLPTPKAGIISVLTKPVREDVAHKPKKKKRLRIR